MIISRLINYVYHSSTRSSSSSSTSTSTSSSSSIVVKCYALRIEPYRVGISPATHSRTCCNFKLTSKMRDSGKHKEET